MSEEHLFEVGEMILVTFGEYSNFEVIYVVRVEKPFLLEQVKKDFIDKITLMENTIDTTKYYSESYKDIFCSWFVNKSGYVSELSIYHWWVGDDNFFQLGDGGYKSFFEKSKLEELSAPKED